MIRSTFALVLGLAVASVAGCAIDESSNPGAHRCTADSDCTGGGHCHHGFCAGGGAVDAGDSGGMDGSPDMGVDTGVDTGIDMGALDMGMPDVPDVGLDAGDCGVPETCNGMDDDCDSMIDELPPTACNTPEAGECRAGHYECATGGAVVCRRDNEPTDEMCNNLDDDCDTLVDEATTQDCYPPAIGGCMAIGGTFVCQGACATGRQACVMGAYGTCDSPTVPAMEACGVTPAADDNCDGNIDEGCSCTPMAMVPCYGGDPDTAGIGECHLGTQRCNASGTGFGACTGWQGPMAETCSNPGQDDDCDGTDDDVPGTGGICADDTAMGVCHDGILLCDTGGAITCVTPMSMMETCDTTDDDCDGTVDEDFDLTLDEAHCGACDTPCPMGATCCGSACSDTETDHDHCGSCDVACSATETCCDSGCTDTMGDEMNCGACGVACDATQQCCGGTCIDTRGDEANCGMCGMTCASGQQCCGSTCRDPSVCAGCSPACGVGQTCCDATCVDRMTDEQNCGMCGMACAAGQVCCGGSCVASDITHCGGSCGACTGGSLCCGGSCVPNDFANCGTCGTTCAAGTTCCGTGCFDLQTSSGHCGTCPTMCSGARPSCSAGHCCGAGQTWCGASTGCVNLLSDRDHCGTCAHACFLGLACNGGMCL